MDKIDATVKKETLYIAMATVILSTLMQAIFLITGKWDYTVLLGNLLGAVAAIGNFFVMGLGVQKALGKDEKEAKSVMKLSQTVRMLVLFVIAMVGYLVPVFNTLAVVLPYIFPRLAITLRPFFMKK